MKRPYLLLLVATLLVSALLASLGRSSHRAGPAPAPTPAAPTASVSLEIVAGTVRPETVSVPSGSRVLLRVLNSGRAPTRFTLAGYEDRLPVRSIPPGATFETAFVADRPGDDFAWLIEREPHGRFAVTGSHLVEGHR